MTPSPEAFEIKPLEWRWDEARHEYEAETAVGSYTANLRGDGFWSVRFYPCKGQCVSVAKVEHDDDDQFAFKPKRVAEEHHRKRLLEALTPSEALRTCRKERDEAREALEQWMLHVQTRSRAEWNMALRMTRNVLDKEQQ